MDASTEHGRTTGEVRRLRPYAIVLTVLATLLFALAAYVRDEEDARWRRPSPQPGRADVDAVLHAAVLEFTDGAWRVRPGTAQTLPTLGHSLIRFGWSSEEEALVPGAPPIWPAGAAVSLTSRPIWSIEVAASPERARRGDAAFVSVEPTTSTPGSFLPPESAQRFRESSVFFASGFQPHGYPSWRGSADHDAVPVARLTTGPPWDTTDVDAWRRHVLADLRACADRGAPVDGSFTSWSAGLKHSLALAILLAPDDSLPDLRRLSASVERVQVHGAADLLRVLHGAEAVANGRLGSRPRRGLADLAGCFVLPKAFLRLISRDKTRADGVRQLAARTGMDVPKRLVHGIPARWEPPPWAPWAAWSMACALALALGLVAVKRPRVGEFTPARRRDAVALLLGFAACALEVPLVGVLTTVTPALLVLALLLAAVRRDPRLRIRSAVIGLFAGAGALLPVAEALDAAWLDAGARAMAFAAAALLATGTLTTPTLHSDPRPPVRAMRRRREDIPQLLAIALGLAIVIYELLNLGPPAGFSLDAWRLATAGGLGVALFAGVLLHLAPRSADGGRAPPAGAIAVTVGAAVHGALFASAPSSIIGSGFMLFGAVASALILLTAWLRLAVLIHRGRMVAT